MFVASFDNRAALPEYIYEFLRHTTRFCDLNFITPIKPAKIVQKIQQQNSRFALQILNPRELPQYLSVQGLLADVFSNLSTNPYQFEKACFDRWLALNAATSHLEGDEYVCLLDTDFLIGMSPDFLAENCTKINGNKKYEFLAEWEIGAKPDAIGPEITILRKSYLFGFCKYMITNYFSRDMRNELRARYFDRIGNGLSGGVCDMTALGAYARKNSQNIFNLNELSDLVLVGNINRFLQDPEQKADWVIDLNPASAALKANGQNKMIIGIHFQGHAKCLIALFIRLGSVLTFKDCVNDSRYSGNSQSNKKIGIVRKIWLKLGSVIRSSLRA